MIRTDDPRGERPRRLAALLAAAALAIPAAARAEDHAHPEDGETPQETVAEDPAERPLGPGTSRTAGRVVDRERDPLSVRVWTTALYMHQVVPDAVLLDREEAGEPPQDLSLALGGLRVLADYNRRGRREGVFARIDGLYEHRILTPPPSFTGRPVAGTWHSDAIRYRVADAHVGYRRGPYLAQVGRSVIHQAGFQMVDGVALRYRSAGFSGTVFGGLSPHPFTLNVDPRFVTAGGGAGWIGPNGGLDVGAAFVLFEGEPDRLTLTQRGHLRAGPDGLAFHSLVVVDALTAVGLQARMLSVSTDYVPATGSRVGLTLSHFGAPLPGAFATRYGIEEQILIGEVHDADLISNRALFAAVPRTNLRLYGVVGLSDEIFLYGLGNVQRRAPPQVAVNQSVGPEGDVLPPLAVGGIENAAGATLGARTIQRRTGFSADASYSFLLGFNSQDQVASLLARYEVPGGRLGAELGGTRIHSVVQAPTSSAVGVPERAGPHVRWQAFGQLSGRVHDTVVATAMYRALLGEEAPHHTAFLRLEYRY